MDIKSTEFLLNEVKDHILSITLNRPDCANAFSIEMIDELVATLNWADECDDIYVITITGAGKHFCAGGDIKAMNEKSGMFAGGPDELRRRYQKGIQKIPKAMEALQKPTIALINGAAIGAGCDFAAMCDLRLGCDKTKMGETFSKLGLVPGDGGTYFLPRIIGYARACEMFLTGKTYNSTQCKEMGLLNECYSVGELLDKGRDYAKDIASNDPTAIQMTKKALKLGHLKDLQTSLDLLAAFQGISQNEQSHQQRLKALLS